MLVYQRVHWRGGNGVSNTTHFIIWRWCLKSRIWTRVLTLMILFSILHSLGWSNHTHRKMRIRIWKMGWPQGLSKNVLKNHTFYLTDMLALWHAIWQILHDKICSYSLTFYLLYLTRILTSNLAFYLTYIPTFYWTNIVKVWQIYLTCILTFYPAFALADYLTLYLAFPSDTFWHLSDKYSHSFWHFAWHMFWQFISPTIHRLLTYILTSYFGILPGISLHSNPDILTNISLAHNPGHVFEKVPTWQIFWPLIWNVLPSGYD